MATTTAVQAVHDLFLYDLARIYETERAAEGALLRIAKEIGDEQIRDALRHHEQETQQQLRNLEACFRILGTEARSATDVVVQSFARAHDAFLADNPAPEAVALFDLEAQEKIESYEGACYRALIAKAHLLDQPECARLLQENLRHEEEQARKVRQFGLDLAQRLVHASGPPARFS